MTDLEAAIAEVKRVVATDGTPWTHSYLPPFVPAAIYYAVATGQLVPAPEAPPVDPVREDSREFGRKALAAWQAMSEDEQATFILDLPYGMILHLDAITRKPQS